MHSCGLVPPGAECFPPRIYAGESVRADVGERRRTLFSRVQRTGSLRGDRMTPFVPRQERAFTLRSFAKGEAGPVSGCFRQTAVTAAFGDITAVCYYRRKTAVIFSCR